MTRSIYGILWGGLGNQLFIYATLRAIALRNGADLVLDDKSGFENDYVYRRKLGIDEFGANYRAANFVERLFFSRLGRGAFKLVNCLSEKPNSFYIFDSHEGFEPRVVDLMVKNSMFFVGYWQDYRYFADAINQIRCELLGNLVGRTDIRTFPVNIEHAYVAVHLRFFSEGTDGLPGGLENYYKAAFREVQRSNRHTKFFIFTDNRNCFDPKAYELYGDFTVVPTRDSASVIADFVNIGLFRTIIIGNSTFAWWAALLAQHAGVRVIAPLVNAGDAGPLWNDRYSMPPDWERIEA